MLLQISGSTQGSLKEVAHPTEPKYTPFLEKTSSGVQAVYSGISGLEVEVQAGLNEETDTLPLQEVC